MKFGVREICDVTFKAAAANQKVGSKVFKKYQPVFMIDTATTSSLEQATTTVYAQGGKGYARLIAWEGEKTMTFTVTDALMSPMGLAVLSGAGLIKHDMDDAARVHVTVQKSTVSNKVVIDLDDLKDETGLNTMTKFTICNKIPMYATTFTNDGSANGFYEIKEPGAAIDVTAENSAELEINADVADGTVVVVDFYLVMNNSVTTVNIKPEDFGGFFYVEAQTLFRDEATGQDLAANLTFPKVKIQSAFTFTMAATGDPSTFDFVMDAFPGYALCRPEEKTMCDIQIISIASNNNEASDADFCKGVQPDYETPVDEDQPTPPGPTPEPGFNTNVAVVPSTATGLTEDEKANQAKTTVARVSGDNTDSITVTIAGGVNSLNMVEPKTGWGSNKWVALDYNTGESTIEGIKYINRGTTTTLGAEDIADATELGLGAGHMVVWVKAPLAKTTPATFRLEKDDKAIDVTITAVDGE